jgi:streptomycin 6-kinase
VGAARQVPPLPAPFTRTIRATFGAAGEAWLAGLPAILADGCARWGLVLDLPFDLSYNYVAPAIGPGGRAVVLKSGVPCRDLTTEIAALRAYGGHGAVRLLDADADAGLLLLERVLPGTPLSALDDDDQATLIGATAVRELWRPPPDGHAFPAVADWAAGLGQLRPHFGGSTGPFPVQLVDRAEGLFRDLLASAGPPELLHGDFHHGNLLWSDGGRWVAIDPKGLVGERAFDLANFLCNPVDRLPGWPDRRARLARRADLLAERLDLDRRRVLGWAAAYAVLSTWWDYEDHGATWQRSLTVAEDLAALAEGGDRP